MDDDTDTLSRLASDQDNDPPAAPDDLLEAFLRRRREALALETTGAERAILALARRLEGVQRSLDTLMSAHCETIRSACEALIEGLLTFLDHDDGDPELEEDDPGGGDILDEGEPSLGATHAMNQERVWNGTHVCDVDLEYDGEDHPSADAEPSIGSVASSEWRSQEDWATAGTRDFEDEHDGAEPDEDGESSLGATVAVNQQHAWRPDASGFYSGEESEPSLGSVAADEHSSQTLWARGSSSDTEGDEHDGREPDQDGEPSLGATNHDDQRVAWGDARVWGSWEGESEPNEGSLETVDQRRWSVGGRGDREDERD